MQQTIDDHILAYGALQFVMDATVMFAIVIMCVSLTFLFIMLPP